MSQSYPENRLQYFIEPWWVQTAAREPERGRLLWVFMPHVEQRPFALIAEGRTEPTSHSSAQFRLEALDVRHPPRDETTLPVAAMPLYDQEVRLVFRAKRRPALVLSTGGPEIPPAIGTRSARHQTQPAMLVAPFYGVSPSGSRAGWNPALLERIQRCEYPQYLWDHLPIPHGQESILRLDHLRPIGRTGGSFELTNFKLSVDALQILDEWLVWLFEGGLPKDGLLAEIRASLLPGDLGQSASAE